MAVGEDGGREWPMRSAGPNAIADDWMGSTICGRWALRGRDLHHGGLGPHMGGQAQGASVFGGLRAKLIVRCIWQVGKSVYHNTKYRPQETVVVI